jgi:hypothetical protein
MDNTSMFAILRFGDQFIVVLLAHVAIRSVELTDKRREKYLSSIVQCFELNSDRWDCRRLGDVCESDSIFLSI